MHHRQSSKKESTSNPLRRRSSTNPKSKNEMLKLTEKNELLEKELKRISATARAIESERDFYFKVLLKVETACKNCGDPSSPAIKNIMEILYSSNDEAGKEKGVDLTSEDPIVEKPVDGEE